MLFLLLPSDSSIWYASALLAILANVSFGASVVAMNAYLPSLAKESPEVAQVHQEIFAAPSDLESPGGNDGGHHSEPDPNESPEAPLIPRHSSDSPGDGESDAVHSSLSTLKAKYETTLSRATSRISSLGIAIGYGAGILLLIVALVPVTKLGGSTFALRLAIGLSGVWWAVFSVPAAIWLPGARVDEVKRGEEAGELADDGDGWGDGGAGRNETEARQRDWRTWSEIRAAWVRLGDMLRWTEILKLRNTFKYLAAWFLLSDGKSSNLAVHSSPLLTLRY
jgi:UMF1 family MFS transporter